MKAFGKTVGKTVVFCLVMMLMCSFVYPAGIDRGQPAYNEGKGRWK